ncbi:hypothetical protein [Prevotella intermedia]|uniref:hypothetical protein n=1 Tax=Prevotella intermedia TaxID=28131 RepID=UPI0012FDFB35|nr:hypothetical protein [Prevotella intermedia]
MTERIIGLTGLAQLFFYVETASFSCGMVDTTHEAANCKSVSDKLKEQCKPPLNIATVRKRTS